VDETTQPTRWSDAIFRGKAALLQFQRARHNLAHSIRRHPQRFDAGFTHALASSATQLWTDTNPSEAWYQRGKIQNLRVAASRLHGCVIPAGEIFSFWQQVGRAKTRKGYAPGRMLQEGCMIPAIGGGLCQLSNALYQVALEAGCEILERHPHSRIVPGSATADGRDATVAWNYIDLRFRSSVEVQLRVVLTTSQLRVSLHAREGALAPVRNDAPKPVAVPGIFSDHACESCGNTRCFRHDPPTIKLETRSATAFLLDNAWPEFKEYVATHHAETDMLAIPMDGTRWRKPQYAWPTARFKSVQTATFATLVRAARSRQLAAQGAARQRAMLDGAAALAKELRKSLTSEIDVVCISQSMLPFLWKAGALGGRRIHVLMTQLPIRAMEAALDRAFTLHPESMTLHDFRAEPWLVEAEDQALANAEQIVTPHAGIAALFRAKATLLDWIMPPRTAAKASTRPTERPTILFPSSTLGRKGAYELREALHGMDVRLLLGGRVLENEKFWDGFDVEFGSPGDLANVSLVAQPSIVESQPRNLLRAIAAGVPIVTTPESGLHAGSGAIIVEAMNAQALQAAIAHQLGRDWTSAQARQLPDSSAPLGTSNR
jgi:hypothetical protein